MRRAQLQAEAVSENEGRAGETQIAGKAGVNAMAAATVENN